MLKTRLLSKYMEKQVFLAKLKHIWTSHNVVKSPLEDVVIPEMPVPEYIWSNMEKWSTKTALVCSVTKRQLTYNEMYKQSRTLGASLRRKFDVKDGDPVAVMMPNMPEYATVLLGILSAGGIVTTLNPVYTSYEVKRQILLSNPKLAVTVPDTVPILQDAFKQNNVNIPIIVIDTFADRPENTISYKEIVENTIDLDILKDVKTHVEDTAFLLYSSGTTGLPKGVELSHKNIVANAAQQSGDGSRLYQCTSESHQDTALAYLPFFHCYGLSVNLLHKLSVGLRLITLPRFQPTTFLDALDSYKCHLLYMAPPTVLFLATDPNVKAAHFQKLNSAISAAAPTPLPDIHRFIDKVGREIHFGQAYGLTETSPLATIGIPGSKDYTSVGTAIPNVMLRIVDHQMKNLGPDELGELVIKGPNIMKGYKNNEEANRQVFLQNNWLRTGDLARIDENGTVTIADRLKELIKVNAYQVPPAELESLIKEHPAVLDAAVIGIPDSSTGEKPKAIVVLHKGAKVTEKNIFEHVAERVAPYKRLKEVQFVETIHKSPTGKILRRLLLEDHIKNRKLK